MPNLGKVDSNHLIQRFGDYAFRVFSLKGKNCPDQILNDMTDRFWKYHKEIIRRSIPEENYSDLLIKAWELDNNIVKSTIKEINCSGCKHFYEDAEKIGCSLNYPFDTDASECGDRIPRDDNYEDDFHENLYEEIERRKGLINLLKEGKDILEIIGLSPKVLEL